jgi:hypothetical protein
MLKVDIGCGAAKRAGFIGVDIGGNPDLVCDVAVEPLPFDDLSADHIYSSHTLEHINNINLPHVFKEMTRITAADGLIEIWHPHVFHSDAYLFGHVNYLSEAIYDHLGCTHRSFWKGFLGAQWVLEEIRYRVEAFVLEDIRSMGMEVEFALCYLRDVIKELGIFIRVDRTGEPRPDKFSRFVCSDRKSPIIRLSDGPRR